MENLKVLLIGQPNVGKSSLLNSLVGPRVTVSNYPGTTVEVTKAKKRFNNTKIEFVLLNLFLALVTGADRICRNQH